MDLRVSHSCPSCSAPVEMREADRLSDCSFCGIKNYMVSGAMLRFMLPHTVPEGGRAADMLYFPYLRFKGNVYSCSGHSVDGKVLDTTHQGRCVRCLPVSLGLRPQAMAVGLVDDRFAGRFIIRKESGATILRRASRLAEAFSDEDQAPLYHRAFIGETLSCVYQPLYVVDDEVYDAVLHRPLGTVEPWLAEGKNVVGFRRQWQPRFIATVCPHCGDSMEGARDALSLHCRNCDSCWLEKGGRFVPMPFLSVAGAGDDNTVHLPFWRVTVKSLGLPLTTFGDLLRVTNQPVVVRARHRTRALDFWIPALKIRPKSFLYLAKAATLSQLKFGQGEKKVVQSPHPVTLPLTEAVQALKSVVAEMALNKKKVLPQLPQLSFTVTKSSVVFLPFVDNGYELVQLHSGFSVASVLVTRGDTL